MTSIDILGAQASVRTYDVLTTGMVGATVEFRFDKSWDNLVRTAVFRQGAVTKDVVNIGTTAKIPPEVLMIPGLSVKIGVLGTNSDGTVVIPTVWAETRPVKDGTDPSGDESADPTLPVWEQILATIGDMHSLSTEAKGNLVASINELVQLCEDGTVDAEYIQQEVEKYLKENPVTETDPTVPAWAKQPEKPKYTAQEVGALPADTVIPTIPDNVSAFHNDAGYLTEHQDISGKLDASALPTAINTALAQAKASGEFDGKDGTSATHSWNGTVLTVTSASGTSSADLKGAAGKDGNPGADGKDGSDGKDGTSATHSWNGTTLTITSASGTSSANLKGDKGDKGDSIKGDKGDTGAAGVSVSSVKQTTTSSADGGSNVVTVTLSNGTTSTFTVKNGSKGSSGTNGTNGKDGKTPVKGTDYFTEADKEEIVQQVIAALGTPVFGRVDADNNIILTGNLAEGNSYTVKYEDAEGNVMDVGSIVFEAPPAYTNLLEPAGYVKDKRLSSTDGTTEKDATGFYLTGYIPVPLNGVVRFQGINVGGSSYGNTVYIYDSSKKFLGAPASTGLNEADRNCQAVYDSSNYLKQFTAKSTIMKSSPAFAGGYMRFGAVSISDGAIITVNEEIV